MTAFIRVLLIACVTCPVPVVLAAPEADAPRTLLVLGDSISAAYGIEPRQGWVHLLAERLDARDAGYEVVNASISGETTGGGLGRLPGLLERRDPDVVILELGGNDGLRGYPIGRIRDNLSAMVRLSREAGARVLLVGMVIPPNYGARYVDAFRGIYETVAAEEGVVLVRELLDGPGTDPALMQDDGIHPTAAAQPRLLDDVWPALAPLLVRTEPAATEPR